MGGFVGGIFSFLILALAIAVGIWISRNFLGGKGATS
jgi:hypothetical protein